MVTDHYGRTPAAEFGPLALIATQNKLVERHLARGYINALVRNIRRMFKWGVSRQLVQPGVYQALAAVEGLKKGRTSARETQPVKPVEDVVVEATLPHLPSVVADMVRFQRLTGCRPGEVCNLRPMDLDRSREVWAFTPASHKTEHHEHSRIIFVGPRAQAILLPYLLRPADAHCFSPTESVERRNAARRARRKTKVQPSQVSRKKARPERVPKDRYTRHSYRQAVDRAIEKANKTAADEAAQKGTDPVVLDHWHPNQLRHTAGTDIRRQYGLEAAQVVLGHAKADVTEVYAERDHALAADVMRQIG